MTLTKLAAPLLCLLGFAVTAAGCASQDPGGGSVDELRVVASIYPLQFVAQRIAGDHLEVSTLTSVGQEPHDLELSVARTVAIEEADLALYIKGLQPAVDEALDGQDQGLDAFDLLRTRPSAVPGLGEAHAIDNNPHVWLDPAAMATVAEEVERRLADLDPTHAGDYATNLADLEGDLVALDSRFSTGLSHCAVRTIVVNHDAFGYLGARYDLKVEAISGLAPDAEPSPAHLADLQRLIRRYAITTVFTETLASPELADSLAGDLGIQTAVLDPIEGLTDATADEDYLSLMDRDLAALKTANRCRKPR